MRYNRALLLLIPISAIFLATSYNVSFASSAQALSLTSNTECSGESCYTISCLNDQPCQTFLSSQPSFVQPSQEVTTPIMQPVEETPIMQSPEHGIVMQPIEDPINENYIEVPVESCDDGLDNDDDGKVDEECGAATSSSALPNDLIDGGEKEQNEEYEHSDDESNEGYEEKENED